MQETKPNEFRPVYVVARFLAVSRICLFVNFANLAIYRHSTGKQNNLKKQVDLLNNSYSASIK